MHPVIRAYDISDPSNPSFYGYVTTDGGGGFTVTQDASHATVIQAQLASLQPGNLAFVSPPYNGYPELGFAGPYNDIGSGSASIVYMAGTQSTTKKSPPISTPNQSFASGTSEPTESAVWYLVNAATLEVHPQWINGNGGSPTTYLIYLTQLHYFVITGDPNTVRSVYGTYGPNIVMRFNLDTVNVPP
ncbi:hypothetical protein FRB90_000611 [Tulasnella sp. 427]|nr:hypothetical protein FRB90_000611 [Tulasnella sp. 427]